MFFFFFQAEDGIRDLYVTGVQTCALPISRGAARGTPAAAGHAHHRRRRLPRLFGGFVSIDGMGTEDRKSTRLNSSHVEISYAVFCLKKKTEFNRHRDCLRPFAQCSA